MKIVYSPTALEHLEYWRRTSPATVTRIKSIQSDISEHPFSGIAKPEPLKGPLKGLWSRRINQEHRLIYKVDGQEIQVLVLSMGYHYNK
ncbi:MAG: Txe/YoeB family addiction module toxin [Bacteroidales bacterium]|nr:Txe/YoeB family addiction module toxin [Bacteroidales bacterium]